MKRKILAALLSMVLVLSLMPMAVSAEVVKTPVKYLDASGVEQQAECFKLGEDAGDLEAGGWYYVIGDVTINNTVGMLGDLNLILTDGSVLEINGTGVGIEARDSGFTLNIFAQSEDVNVGVMGVSGAPGVDTDGYAGIVCKKINMYGGAVTVSGGDGGNSTPQGGCRDGSDGLNGGVGIEADVFVYGGSITAFGGKGASGEGADDGIMGVAGDLFSESGGNGGNGGNGGVGVMGNVTVNDGLFFSNAGEGDNGGNGGAGGKGYAGAYDSQYASPEDYTCGSNGGNGGEGGDNAYAVCGLLTVNGGIAGLAAGKTGNGGNGGAGGNGTGYSGVSGSAGEGGAGGVGGTFENPTGTDGVAGVAGDDTTAGPGGNGGNGGNAGQVYPLTSETPVIAEGAVYQTKYFGAAEIGQTYTPDDLGKYEYLVIAFGQEDPPVPTGDAGTASLWLLLLALSVFGAGAALIFKRK